MRHRGSRHLRSLLPSFRHVYPQRRRTRWLPARHSLRLACAVAGFFLLFTGALVAAGEFGDDTVTASDAPRPGARVTDDASRSDARESLRPTAGLEPSGQPGGQTPERRPAPAPEPAPASGTPTGAAPAPTGDATTLDPLAPGLERSGTPVAEVPTGTPPDTAPVTPTDTPKSTSTDVPTTGLPAPTASPPPTDRVSPQTTLLNAPAPFDDSADAEFDFEASEAATFRCSLDGAAYEPCSSGTEYDGLDAGWHDFAVRAVDESGNVETTPATWHWHTAPLG